MAVSILMAIVAMLSVIFSEVTRAWQKGEGRNERRRSARSLADFIAAEMQGALLPVETVSKAGQSNLQFLINPPVTHIDDAAPWVPDEYRNPHAGFWQAPIATDTSFGEVAVIGYFVKWAKTDAAPVSRPVLCRFFVNPSKPDASGGFVRNPDFVIYNQPMESWVSKSLLERVAPADKASGYVGLFAENVVGLWFRCAGLDGVELPKIFDSRIGYPFTVQFIDGAGKPQTRIEKRYLPAVVTVSVAQVESRLAARMDHVWEDVRALSREPGIRDAAEFVTRMEQEAGSNPGLRPLLSGLRTYTTRIQLINGR